MILVGQRVGLGGEGPGQERESKADACRWPNTLSGAELSECPGGTNRLLQNPPGTL